MDTNNKVIEINTQQFDETINIISVSHQCHVLQTACLMVRNLRMLYTAAKVNDFRMLDFGGKGVAVKVEKLVGHIIKHYPSNVILNNIYKNYLFIFSVEKLQYGLNKCNI